MDPTKVADTVRVIVENWPKKDLLGLIQDYVPIGIAVLALGVSLYSVRLTRTAFVASHRPYVWGASYGVIDSEHKTIIPVPFRVLYRVKNAPARILRTEVSVNLDDEQLFTHVDTNRVAFPDDRSEWAFTIGEGDFRRMMDRPDGEKARLSRRISLDYSFLGGGQIFHYTLHQVYDPAENQWRDIRAEAD